MKAIIAAGFLGVLFCPVNYAFADTIVDAEISEDITWTKEGSPYLIQDGVTIDSSATLSIASGVVVNVDSGQIDVLGRLLASGTSGEPITFTSPTGTSWWGIEFSNPDVSSSMDNVVVRYASTAITDFYSKDLTLSNITVSDGEYGIDAYESRLSLTNFSAENMSRDALDFYGGSDVILKNITIKNVGAGIGVYVDSKVDIFNALVDHSEDEALALYDECSVHMASSTFTNGDSDGIGVYDSSIDIHDSVISGFSDGAGIANYSSVDYPTNTISLTKNEITNNYIGMSIYSDNSSYAISNNAIYQNASYGLEWYGEGAIDVSNNYWGDSSGPYHDQRNLEGEGDVMYDWDNTVIFSPWLAYWGTPPVSNVLFLPGIEGSRLYEGTGCGKASEEKLWEPIADSIWSILRGAGNDKMRDLFLDEAGESECTDVYAKEDDVIDVVRGSNIYKTFIDEMNGLESAGDIEDWKAVAYDWRLSLDDLMNNGTARDGKVFYEEATSTPYIEQTLRALANSSKTGKVTIVAHSNGGLVAKALMQKLGNGPSSSLVDKVVMVGAPQSGAPEALGASLFGYNAGIYKLGFPIVSNSVAQEFAKNSPMTYHLLPSQDYFDSVMTDAEHPVARFAGDAYAPEISAYGDVIGTASELHSFLSDSALNSSLITYANTTHSELDSWAPPAGIEVSQIAGWGADTVAGIEFYTPQLADAITALTPVRAYRPIFTEDGDGIVPAPSALMMASSESVKRYWLDLHSYNGETHSDIRHKDLFEIPSLEDFIKNIIKNSTSTLPAYIVTSQPQSTSNKKLTFFLHSPLTLQLTDSSGNVTGLAEDGSMTQDIPDSTYGEFGDVKYITVPQGSSYELTMHGQDTGTFSLDMQESSGDVVTNSSTIASVPTTASTLASLTISGSIDTASALTVDENGDGKTISITPKVGETVMYVPYVPAPTPTPPTVSAGMSGSGRISIPIKIPIIPTTKTTPTLSVNTPISDIGADVDVVSVTQPVQIKKTAPVTVTKPKKEIKNVPQTASVYDASQQPVLQKIGAWVYNGLYSFWLALKKFF